MVERLVQKALRDRRESQELLVPVAQLDLLDPQDQKEREVCQVHPDLQVRVTQAWKVQLGLQETQDLLALLANRVDPAHLALLVHLEPRHQHPT